MLDSAPEKARALAYDVVLNGTELGGGSIRISDPDVQRRMFNLLAIDDATAQQRFGFLLEGLRAGAPPHGGIAFGFDRIAMLLSGATSLRDVIAFPKTTAARALFEGAPTPVGEDDLKDLHIRLASERRRRAMSDEQLTQRLNAEGADLLTLAGVNDSNLIELSRITGVRVSLRGDTLSLTGPGDAVERATPVAQRMLDTARQQHDAHAGRRAALSKDTAIAGRQRRAERRDADRAARRRDASSSRRRPGRPST